MFVGCDTDNSKHRPGGVPEPHRVLVTQSTASPKQASSEYGTNRIVHRGQINLPETEMVGIC